MRKFLRAGHNGFTFIEVMVTIMILSTGIVMIYKTFLISLDQQNYLLHRLYANNLLDLEITQLQHVFQEKGRSSLKDNEMTKNAVIHNKTLAFAIKTFFQDIPELEGTLQMDIGIFWLERGRTVRLTRSVYLSR